ncbi:glutathione S-transferase 1-like [Hyposmocoma kahamanoa]|uniref:glutathione S-transferase 1-like n=1 Tax=Hyposmocoma kahamanoa TaxID=1477025 RepID=UPI000E6D6A68|nr:glutathione S-transferase 1-like [Hyposmocoma kahamanoa]
MGISSSKKAAGIVLKNCTVWKADRSPACRSVLMALDALNLSIKEVDVNMDRDEHKAPDMIAMNSLQTLPILKDHRSVITDSHAIMTYLASRYGYPRFRRGYLLPRDPGDRARIEQLMHYNSGVLQPKYRVAAYPILYNDCRHVMPQQVSDIECSYNEMEIMLGEHTWFGGTWPTLSDITLVATVSTLNIMVPIDATRFPRLSRWFQLMSKESYYLTGNAKGLKEFSDRIDRTEQSEEGGKIVDIKFPRLSSKRRSLTQAEQQGPVKSTIKMHLPF